MVERNFKKIQVNYWKPEKEGDQVQGTLVKKEEDVGANNSTIYGLETEDHKQIGIWSSVVLDDLLAYVKIGDFIRITYKGTKPNQGGKQDTKLFDVEIAEAEETKEEAKE